MVHLLDGNVLIALTAPAHVHHQAAHRWFSVLEDDRHFATCPITQGTLMRVAVAQGASVATARRVLAGLIALPEHDFWGDDLSYLDVDLDRVIGRRQVTDAYLAGLARHHDGRLATFDAGLVAVHGDVARLIARADLR